MTSVRSGLPLKVKIAIREQWDKEDSPVKSSFKALQQVLGYEVVVEPEWQLLVAELDDCYEDKGHLVAVVAGCVLVWAKSITELLEDAEHEGWTETVLEKTKSAARLRLYVEVESSASSSNSEKASTTWSEQRTGFVVILSKKEVLQPAELFPVFRGNLLACFDGTRKTMKEASSEGGAAAGAGDDWADIKVDSVTGGAQVVEKEHHQAPTVPVVGKSKSKVEFLPTVASLPRPDELFLRPPYHLVVTGSHGGEIEIQGSHSPSLQLIADYFKRWCRVNPHDTRNPPAVQVTLHQSAFGLGEMFDRLVLSTRETKYTNKFQVTVPMVVALIEGVLEYELLYFEGLWVFKRDSELRSFTL